MGQKAEGRRRKAVAFLPSLGHLVASTVCLLVASGCSGTSSRTVENDPLLGPGGGTPVSRPGPTTAVTGAASATNAGSRTELTELPAPKPRITAADLAAGTTQTLDNAPTLRIGTGPTTPKPGDVAAGSPPGPSTPTIDRGPWRGQGTLQGPIPVSDPHTPSVSSSGNAGATQSNSLQQWLDLLKQQGVTTHGPDKTATGEYQFLCLVPDKQIPTKFYRYEATAPADPINAVRAVIDQMRRDGR